LSIQLVIFHQRGNFLWTGKDDLSIKSDKKYYADVARGFQRFEIVKKLINNFSINIPKDTSQFLYDYNQSKFIECNSELAQKNFIKMGANYTEKAHFKHIISNCTTKLTGFLESKQKYYFLTAGSLLGKISIQFESKTK
jgi:hypothetical protein